MQVQALPAFRDNYIWALATGGAGWLVVDPGEPGPVFQAAAQGLAPSAILLTHHHSDHIDGVSALLERWPGIPVHAPADERIHEQGRRVRGGDILQLGDVSAHVIEVPGHTRSHIAFHVKAADEEFLFCGDTLFSLGCGRLFEGTPAQMLASLELLATLPGHTRVCCGHEYTLANAAFARTVDPDNSALQRRIQEAQAMFDSGQPTVPSTIESERSCNPFLRSGAQPIVAALEARVGHVLPDPVERFAELRRWKDGFG